jgi:hypothetical protein
MAHSNDGLHARVFGLAFEWNEPQPNTVESMALDAAREQYSDTIEHAFTLSLQCASNATSSPVNSSTTCPQDGDTIETTIYITPQKGNATPSVPSEVRILTDVQAAISCAHTMPTIQVVANTALDAILPSAPMSVHLLAMDLDGQPIKYSRAELELQWDGVAVPVDWIRSSNKYSWKIPPDRDAGVHEIVVLQGTKCTLLSLKVTVTSDTTQMIVAGCIAGAVIILVVALGVFLRRNRHRAAELILSLISYEGLLTGELCLETWYGCTFWQPTKPRSESTTSFCAGILRATRLSSTK